MSQRRTNNRSNKNNQRRRPRQPVKPVKISGGTKPPLTGTSGGSMAEKIIQSQKNQAEAAKRDPPAPSRPARQQQPQRRRQQRPPAQQQRQVPGPATQQAYQQPRTQPPCTQPVKQFQPNDLLEDGEVFGKVRKVLSGDTLYIELLHQQQEGGLRTYKTVSINDIIAPRISRSERHETDALFAWESREFLRRHLIHKIAILKLAPEVGQKASGGFQREYGQVWFRPNGKGQFGPNRDEWKDVGAFSIASGMSEVKSKAEGENADKLRGIEETARNTLVGKHEPRPVNVSENDKSWFRMHHREVDWSPDLKQLFNQCKGQKLSAIVDDVREGSCVRCELITSDQRGIKTKLIWLELSGLECPRMPKPIAVQKREAKKAGRPFVPAATPEFAEKAREETVIRLLHREVDVIIEHIDAYDNLYGTVVFHRGDIGQYLLQHGLARVVPWTCQRLDEYQGLEAQARAAGRNIWSLPKYQELPALGQVESGVVSEVTSGDSVVVETPNGDKRRLFLASVQSPRRNRSNKKPDPYYYEAKEYVRKGLISKQITFELAYTRKGGRKDKKETFEYATIMYDGNRCLNSEMVKQGYGTVVEHRKGESRSKNYQQLRDLQYIAARTEVGVHNPAPQTKQKLEDFTNGPRPRRRKEKKKEGDEQAKAREEETQQLYIRAKRWAERNLGVESEAARRERRDRDRQASRGRNNQKKEDGGSLSTSKPPTAVPRPKRTRAVVEYCFSADRIKVRLGEENALLNLILAGIDVKSVSKELEEKATKTIRDLITQKEVEIEVERVDRKANFIGNMYTSDGTDLSVHLLSNGWAKIFKPKNPSLVIPVRNHLRKAEDSAKDSRVGCWENWTPPPPPEEKKEASEEPVVGLDDKQKQQQGGRRSQGGRGGDRGGRGRGRGKGRDRGDRQQPRRVRNMTVEVSQLVDGVTFYARNINDKLKDKIEPALASINPSTVTWNDKFEVKQGSVVAGLFADGSYYRCRIAGNAKTDEDGRNFRCVWIDFGETGMIKESQILEIADPAIREAPPLALKCVLAGVKMPPENSVYYEQSINVFWHAISGHQLNLEILRQNRDTRFVIVKIDKESLNDKLVLSGVLRTQDGRGMRETEAYKTHLYDMQRQSKEAHKGMWEYGDLGSDDESDGPGGRDRGRKN